MAYDAKKVWLLTKKGSNTQRIRRNINKKQDYMNCVVAPLWYGACKKGPDDGALCLKKKVIQKSVKCLFLLMFQVMMIECRTLMLSIGKP